MPRKTIEILEDITNTRGDCAFRFKTSDFEKIETSSASTYGAITPEEAYRKFVQFFQHDYDIIDKRPTVTVKQVVELVESIVQDNSLPTSPMYTLFLCHSDGHAYDRIEVSEHNDLVDLIRQGKKIIDSLTPSFTVEIYQNLDRLPENQNRDRQRWIRGTHLVVTIDDERGLTVR